MTEEELRIELMRVKAREALFKHDAQEKIKELEEQLQLKINFIQEKDKKIDEISAQLDKTTKEKARLEVDFKNTKEKYSFLANQLLAGADISDTASSSIIEPERLSKFISIFNKSKKQFYEAIGIFKPEIVDDSILFLYNLKAKKNVDYIEIYIKNIRKFYFAHPNLPNTDIIFLLECIFELCKIYNKNIAQYALYFPEVNSILDINYKITQLHGLVYVFSIAGKPCNMQLAEYNLLKMSPTDAELTSNDNYSIRSWFVGGKNLGGQKIRITDVLVPGLWDNDKYQFLVPPLLQGVRE